MTTPDTNHDELPEAQARMAALSLKLVERFGPLVAANMLAACAYGTLAQSFSPLVANQYFADLTDNIEMSAVQ